VAFKGGKFGEDRVERVQSCAVSGARESGCRFFPVVLVLELVKREPDFSSDEDPEVGIKRLNVLLKLGRWHSLGDVHEDSAEVELNHVEVGLHHLSLG